MKQLYMLTFILISGVCYGQRGKVYNSSNSLIITLGGPSKSYSFRTDQLLSNYNKGDKQFEFIIPLATIRAVESELDLQIFEDIFDPFKYREITIVGRFNDNLTSLEQFRNSTMVKLDGRLFMFGQSYNVPMQITLTYQDEVLYYSFLVLHNLDPDVVPNNILYLNRLNGEVMFNGLDGRITGKITKVQ